MVASTYVWWRPFIGIEAACALSSTSLAAGTGERGPGWIADPTTGCAMWRAYPLSGETVRWSGACRNGTANGRGVLRRIENDRVHFRYSGEMMEGRYHGKGTLVWAVSGDRYDGDYVNDKQTGSGVYVWKKSGNSYIGRFRNDKPHGVGSFITARGEAFSGTWDEGCLRSDDIKIAIGRAPHTCP